MRELTRPAVAWCWRLAVAARLLSDRVRQRRNSQHRRRESSSSSSSNTIEQ